MGKHGIVPGWSLRRNCGNEWQILPKRCTSFAGKGIRQRKDGLYSARYYTKDGERREKYFKSLPEAKNWLADTKYELRHRVITCNSDMSVDNWFDYWITNIICNRSPNCIRNYTERYKRNVQPVIGTMYMGDVKPMHCQIILI